MPAVVLRSLAQTLKLDFESLQLFVGQILKIDKPVSCVLKSADHFIEFEMHCFGIAVLRVLNQEHHEKGNSCRGGVDDELPVIGKMKRRPGEEPHQDDEHSSDKSLRTTEKRGGASREYAKRVSDDAHEIPGCLVFS